MFFTKNLYSQVDSVFWFAAPESSTTHDEDPVELFFTNLEEDNTVTISQPASSEPLEFSLDDGQTWQTGSFFMPAGATKEICLVKQHDPGYGEENDRTAPITLAPFQPVYGETYQYALSDLIEFPNVISNTEIHTPLVNMTTVFPFFNSRHYEPFQVDSIYPNLDSLEDYLPIPYNTSGLYDTINTILGNINTDIADITALETERDNISDDASFLKSLIDAIEVGDEPATIANLGSLPGLPAACPSGYDYTTYQTDINNLMTQLDNNVNIINTKNAQINSLKTLFDNQTDLATAISDMSINFTDLENEFKNFGACLLADLDPGPSIADLSALKTWLEEIRNSRNPNNLSNCTTSALILKGKFDNASTITNIDNSESKRANDYTLINNLRNAIIADNLATTEANLLALTPPANASNCVGDVTISSANMITLRLLLLVERDNLRDLEEEIIFGVFPTSSQIEELNAILANLNVLLDDIETESNNFRDCLLAGLQAATVTTVDLDFYRNNYNGPIRRMRDYLSNIEDPLFEIKNKISPLSLKSRASWLVDMPNHIDKLQEYFNGEDPSHTLGSPLWEVRRRIGQIECYARGGIENKGILIEGTALMTAYYKVGGEANNRDIFALKGHNAEGRSFLIPMQNIFNSADRSDWYIYQYNSFDIVATEDNTKVTIIPKKDLGWIDPADKSIHVMHDANVSFTITLNRGQTYSCMAVSKAASTAADGSDGGYTSRIKPSNCAKNHLGGSRVSADKDIAITMKDDSVNPRSYFNSASDILPSNSGGTHNASDMVGDQLVPNKLAGTEYIVTRGYADLSGDTKTTNNLNNYNDVYGVDNSNAFNIDNTFEADVVFIYAISNGTNITITSDAGTTGIIPLNAGQSYFHFFGLGATNENAIYIKSVDGSGNLIDKNMGKDIFVLHLTGFNAELGGALIPPIRCTGSDKVAFMRGSNQTFGIVIFTHKNNMGGFKLNGSVLTSLVKNDNTTFDPNTDFHTVPGTSGDDEWVYTRIIEFGPSADENLQTDAVFVKDGTFGIGTAQVITNPNLFHLGIIHGTKSGGCEYGYFSSYASLFLGDDDLTCIEGAFTLASGEDYDEHEWYKWDKSLEDFVSLDPQPVPVHTLVTQDTGTYMLRAVQNGCDLYDTIHYGFHPVPEFELGENISMCSGGSTSFDVGQEGWTYLWNNGDTTQIIEVNEQGEFFVVIKDENGCEQSDTVQINFIDTGQESSVWYFGENAGISFTNTPPDAVDDSQLNATEGCSVISDVDGGLVFYTDGETVWDRQHNIMNNGEGLSSAGGSQAVLIVKKPSVFNLYYVFTISATNLLEYSIVDINQNKVILKNETITPNPPFETTEKVTYVKHKNNEDVWIITKLTGTLFSSHLLEETGLIAPSAGVISMGSTSVGTGDEKGCMKVSPDGTKLAVAMPGSGIFEIFDFNFETGAITNPITLTGFPDAYGVEFSPTGKFFYGSCKSSGEIYQFDMTEETETDINASATLINTPDGEIGALQIAADNKIYVARNNSNFLGSIKDPEVSVCNYDPEYVDLGTNKSMLGLPLFAPSYFYNVDFEVSVNCAGYETDFIITDARNVDSAHWDFGDGNTSDEINPQHIYENAGDYTIRLYVTDICKVTTPVVREITVYPPPIANATTDQTVCPSTTFQITGNSVENSDDIVWSSHSGGFSLPNPEQDSTLLDPYYTSPSSNGIDSLFLTAYPTEESACPDPDIDTLVYIIEIPEINITETNADLCKNGSYETVDAGVFTNSPDLIIWTSDNGGTFTDENLLETTFNPTNDFVGDVVLRLSSECDPTVFDEITINVIDSEAPTANAGVSDTICSNETYTLNGTVSNEIELLWSTETGGIFDPVEANISSLDFTPSQTEIDNGEAIIKLEAFANPACAIDAEDTMKLTIIKYPEISGIDPDYDVCSNTDFILDFVIVENSDNVIWSTGGTGNFVNQFDVNTEYQMSELEKAGLTSELTIIALSLNDVCEDATQSFDMEVIKAPIINGISDETICPDLDFIISEVTTENTTSVTWETTADPAGTFTPDNDVNTTYDPLTIEGVDLLRLVVTGNLPCENDTLEFNLTITDEILLLSGADDTICKGETYKIDSSESNAIDFLWESSSSLISKGENFSDSTILHPVYSPSTADETNGEVTLIVIAEGGCTSTYYVGKEDFVGKDGDRGNWATDNYGSYNNKCGLIFDSYQASTLISVKVFANGTRDRTIKLENSSGTDLETITLNIPDGESRVVLNFPIPVGNDLRLICEANAYLYMNNNIHYSDEPYPFEITNYLSIKGRYRSGQSTNNRDYYYFYDWEVEKTPGVTENVGKTSLIDSYTHQFQNYGLVFDVKEVCKLASVKVRARYPADRNPRTIELRDQFNNLLNSKTIDIPDGVSRVNLDFELPVKDNMKLICSDPIPELWYSTDMHNSDRQPDTYGDYILEINGDEYLEITRSNRETYSNRYYDFFYNWEIREITKDSMILTILDSTKIDLGNDIEICSSDVHQFTTTVAENYFGDAEWFTSGDGNFLNPTTINPTYVPGAGDITLGNVDIWAKINGCLEAIDSMKLTIISAPTVYAGTDQIICSGTDYFLDEATANSADNILWTTSGDGTFVDNSIIQAVYQPHTNDVGSDIFLEIRNTTCGDITDNIKLTITSATAPTANAGTDITICENTSVTPESDAGANTNASGVLWTSAGSGTFDDDAIIEATYTPSQSEIDAGSTKLYLTAIADPACNVNVMDSMILSFQNLPVISAGSDASICKDNTYELLLSTAENDNTLNWSSANGGSFTPSNDILNPTFDPSALEETNGTATITLTATSIAPCVDDVTDNLTLSIVDALVVEAGPNDTICENISGDITYDLINATTNAYDITWTSSSQGENGFTASNKIGNPTYTPSPTDKANEEVTLTMHGLGGCEYEKAGKDNWTTGKTAWWVTDNVNGIGLIFNCTRACKLVSVLVNARNGATYNPRTIELRNSSNVVIQSTVVTIPDGEQRVILDFDLPQEDDLRLVCRDGDFISNKSELNLPYTSDDGTIVITDAIHNGNPKNGTRYYYFFDWEVEKAPQEDEMILTILPMPTIFAGNDGVVCGKEEFPLDGAQVLNTTDYTWTTTGEGHFGDENVLNTVYDADESVGVTSITLTLSDDNCPVSDDLILSINEAPAISISDTSRCSNDPNIVLDAGSGYDTYLWTKNGDNDFSDNNQIITEAVESPGAVFTIEVTKNGCSNSDIVILTVHPEVETTPILPLK